MKRQIKNEDGITLVALIITIVILLILAVITILPLTQTSLFNKTKQAKTITENAQAEENGILESYENQINSISKEINGSRDGILTEEEVRNIFKEEFNKKVKTGTSNLGIIGANTGKEIQIKFDTPFEDNNYTVVATNIRIEGTDWARVNYTILNKEKEGFTLRGYNTNQSTSTVNDVIVNWVLIKN